MRVFSSTLCPPSINIFSYLCLSLPCHPSHLILPLSLHLPSSLSLPMYTIPPPLPYSSSPPQLAKLPPLKATLDSLHSSSVQYSVYDNVSIEPTNER